MPKEFTINHIPSSKIIIENKEYDYFSGTSYLGINQNKEFEALLLEGISKFGMSFGSSRNSSLQLEVYAESEEKLAKWAGAESALTLSSGMLAGQVVAQFFGQESGIRNYEFGIANRKKSTKTSALSTQNSALRTYFYAPQSHSANFHLPNIELPKISFQEWSGRIVEEVSKEKNKHSIIICNSNDALRCTSCNFDWTSQLPDNQEITLIIDDSHGLGITGENGSGIFKKIRVKENVNFIVVSSLHKAMGIPGGVVFGKKELIQKIRQTAYFSSCSPIIPAYLHAYTKADEIYKKNREKLLSNIQSFHSKITDNQLFSFLENFPVFFTLQDSLFDFLFKNKIFIYSFAYPLKTLKPNTRIVLSAIHDSEQIDFLAEMCNEFSKLNKK